MLLACNKVFTLTPITLQVTRRLFTASSTSTVLAFNTVSENSPRTGPKSTQRVSNMSSDSTNEVKYWNRETSEKKSYSASNPVTQEARIVCIADPQDDANKRLYKEDLPDGAKIIAIGSQMSDFDVPKLKDEKANVIFTSHPNSREPLSKLVQELPITWIHSRSAGIDYITSNDVASSAAVMTNAKGSFSSTLAEYTMMAISYFAKDLPRVMKNKNDKNWEKYCIEEIRGKTLGIVGYGDIGRAAARLANAYGMNIIALKRNRPTQDDPLINQIYFGNDKESLYKIMSESDYILCAAPLTPETEGMFDAEAFSKAKKNSVFINVGRGPIVNEDALISALEDKNGNLKGAALDVFATEPLPLSSKLWTLNNVLLSPHNMDMTETFMHESVDFFLDENLPRFLREEALLNIVDKKAGY